MPTPLAPGAPAPPIEGTAADGPRAIVFYKVTCPVCQMAAPKVQALDDAFPGRVVAVGQDPPGRLAGFGDEYGMHLSGIADLAPYHASEAYGVRTVPTLFLLDDGIVLDTVEGWDREGFNRVAGRLAELTKSPYRSVSEPGDGLPPFRPG
jgi:thiol-disulfide isomerase/thioredoxin